MVVVKLTYWTITDLVTVELDYEICLISLGLVVSLFDGYLIVERYHYISGGKVNG